MVKNKKEPQIVVVDQKSCKALIAASARLNPSLGYLHIPKTGGSGVMSFLERNINNISKMPIPLFHTWTLELVKTYFPNMQILFSIRDPLERTVSGFQSRLRMGRPTYDVIWTTEEAAAYAFYPGVEEFLFGLKSDSELHTSAIDYSLNSIRAIKWNYEYYFKSVDYVEANISQFYSIWEINQTENQVNRLIKGNVLSLKSRTKKTFEEYVPKHISNQSASSLLDQFSEDELYRMRLRLGQEYMIYNKLKELATTKKDSQCVSIGDI